MNMGRGGGGRLAALAKTNLTFMGSDGGVMHLRTAVNQRLLREIKLMAQCEERVVAREAGRPCRHAAPRQSLTDGLTIRQALNNLD